jgi:transposase-like protein
MRREYSEETKVAVMAALLAGQAVGEIARQYDVPTATIRSWKSRQGNGNSVAIVATEKKEQIGELLLAYLTDVLIALRAQAKVFANAEYITKQPASEAAVLHGVLADKGIRLLEALAGEDEAKRV